jgi:hypothetical protein
MYKTTTEKQSKLFCLFLLFKIQLQSFFYDKYSLSLSHTHTHIFAFLFHPYILQLQISFHFDISFHSIFLGCSLQVLKVLHMLALVIHLHFIPLFSLNSVWMTHINVLCKELLNFILDSCHHCVSLLKISRKSVKMNGHYMLGYDQLQDIVNRTWEAN